MLMDGLSLAVGEPELDGELEVEGDVVGDTDCREAERISSQKADNQHNAISRRTIWYVTRQQELPDEATLVSK